MADLSQCKVAHDHRARAPVDVPKPGYLKSYIDPIFGSKITRITGDPGTPIPGVAGTWGQISRQNYSKDPVWNADQSLMILTNVEGVVSDLFLDGESYEPLFARDGPDGDVRWHPDEPDIMLYLSRSCEFGRWSVRPDDQKPMFRVDGYSDCYLGPWEGNFSYDGERAAVYAKRESDGKEVAFAVDLAAKKKFPDIDLAAEGVTEIDWVSISALGKYLVVNGVIAEDGADQRGDNTKVFTLQGEQVGPSWLKYGVPSHYDLGVDVNGNEVAVGVAKDAPHNGKVIMRRLEDGDVMPLTVGGYSTHHSTRNYRLRGWAFVTHNEASQDWPPYKNELFAVKLDDSKTIARLAILHNNDMDYESQGFAVPAPDGTRAVFSSNWNAEAGRPVQTYVVDVRHLCF